MAIWPFSLLRSKKKEFPKVIQRFSIKQMEPEVIPIETKSNLDETSGLMTIFVKGATKGPIYHVKGTNKSNRNKWR